MSSKKVNWAYKKHFGDVVDGDGGGAVEITEGSYISFPEDRYTHLLITHTHDSGFAYSCRV